MRDAKQFKALLKSVMEECDQWLDKPEMNDEPTRTLAEKLSSEFANPKNDWKDLAQVCYNHCVEIAKQINIKNPIKDTTWTDIIYANDFKIEFLRLLKDSL